MTTTTDLFRLQPGEETITPTELVEQLRSSGRKVSRRTLSFWQSQGLVPPALRVGSRGGVYPHSIIDLAVFIIDSRDRGTSIETIRELIPLWHYVGVAMRQGLLSLGELERTARSLDLSREANFQVPAMVEHRMLGLCSPCAKQVQWELKDGTLLPLTERVQLSFVIAEPSSTDGLGDVVAWTQLTLPGLGERPEVDDPKLIVLGLPNGIEMRATGSATRPSTEPPARSAPRRRHCATRAGRAEQEVLQLTS